MNRSLSLVRCAAGAALFLRITGVEAAPEPFQALDWLQQKVAADGGLANEGFGRAAAIVGDTAFVGVPNAPGSGVVYVFTRVAGAWTQTQELMPAQSPQGADFGYSFAFDDTTAIIGAPFTTLTDDGLRHQGAAFVFVKQDGMWTEAQRLTAADFAPEAQFGNAVAISNGTILVAAYNDRIGDNAYQGSAYTFKNEGGTWTQSQKLVASDGVGGDDFGAAVALSGGTALIGAPYSGSSQQGAAYVFTMSGGSWNELVKLTADDGMTLDDFGAALALDGDTAVITAQYAGGQGAAYVFTASGGAWSQATRVSSSDGVSGDAFGESVSLSGSTFVAGAPFAAIGDNFGQGAAYVFSGAGTDWSEATKLVADDGAASDFFGYAVASGGGAALVGSPFAVIDGNTGQGAAYFYAPAANDEIFGDGFDGAAP